MPVELRDGRQDGSAFAVLADATRREVIRSLAEQGPATATDLAARLPVTRQAVAKHLAALSAAGMVEPSRQGRETRYRLAPEPLAAVAAWLDDITAASARHPRRPSRAG
jgi:DNA-binding transcriptional ArsR family regulator